MPQVWWFCFMVGLITYKYKTGLFYFNKTHVQSVTFMRLKIFHFTHRKWWENPFLFDRSMIITLYYFLLAFIDQHTRCFALFSFSLNQRKICVNEHQSISRICWDFFVLWPIVFRATRKSMPLFFLLFFFFFLYLLKFYRPNF